MMTRVTDMTLVGLILISILFFGSLTLLTLVVTFNFVNPFSLVIVGFSVLFGLAFGIFAGSWFTKDQLNSLIRKGEWLGAESNFFYLLPLLGFYLF